jgi:hypothetical protein
MFSGQTQGQNQNPYIKQVSLDVSSALDIGEPD